MTFLILSLFVVKQLTLRWSEVLTETLDALIVVSCFFSIGPLLLSQLSLKSITYFLAHIWFLLLILISWRYRYSLDEIFNSRLIFIALLPTLMYLPLETTLHIYEIDVGNFFPRVQRESYVIESGLGFHRVRGFSYESAYLAMYLNVMFPIFLHVCSKNRVIIVLVWILALILTNSVFQGFVFFMFWVGYGFWRTIRLMLDNLASHNEWRLNADRTLANVLVKFSVLVGLGAVAYCVASFDPVKFWVNALAEWYFLNLSGSTESAVGRLELFKVALDLIHERPLTGWGWGAIQELGYRGLSSFYIALVVQLGVFAIPFFLVFTFIFVLAIRVGSALVVFAFVAAWAHLFIVDVFYVPQVVISVMFVFYQYEKKSSEVGSSV